jgi:C4-dicarboxylate-specific signal transduction histidine kinase
METPRSGAARLEQPTTQASEHHASAQPAHPGRLGVLGQLSGAFAHELAQPLTCIVARAEAALQIAQGNVAVPGDIQQSLRDIIGEALHAAEMIQRLRSLFTRGEIKPEPIDLNQIVLDVLALLGPDLAARGVSVTTRLDANVTPLLADGVQIRQVLLNLIVNACDAMSDKPLVERRLTIATRSIDDGRTLECSVADRGDGVPIQHLERIFEPFFSTKSQGLGMGLAICRSIIEAHRGQLWAENDRERGAVFHFALHTAPEDGEPGEHAP